MMNLTGGISNNFSTNDEEYRKRREFLESVDMFNKLPIWMLKRLALYLKGQDYFWNEYVYHAGDVVQGVYLIYEGSFSLEKRMRIEA